MEYVTTWGAIRMFWKYKEEAKKKVKRYVEEMLTLLRKQNKRTHRQNTEALLLFDFWKALEYPTILIR